MIEQCFHAYNVFVLVCELSPSFADFAELVGGSMLIDTSAVAVIADVELFGDEVFYLG